MNIDDVNKARGILKDAMLALLTELADLPSKVTNSRWLDDRRRGEGERQVTQGDRLPSFARKRLVA